MLSRIKNWLFPERVDSPTALEQILAVESARLSQRATTGFCYAKAGSNSELLFKEAVFLDALESCRWKAFAMVLSDMTMIVEGYLRPDDASLRENMWAWLADVYVRILDQQETSFNFTEDKRAFSERLGHARLAPPGPAVELMTQSVQPIYDSLPIHETLRGDDLEVIGGLLRFGAATFREQLERRCNPSMILRDL
jgi:hypothetical protein